MASTAMHVWLVDPLPDFLQDHTLAGDKEADRLREHAARWVQFVASLWSWRNRATFALRYVCRSGGTRVFVVAAAHAHSDGERLSQEVEVLLRSHRLMEDACACRIASDEAAAQFFLENPALVEVRQHGSRTLWRLPSYASAKDSYAGQFDWIPAQEWLEPLVIYPWWGPGGPFLIPMESLISQGIAAALTIYLEPTELNAQESAWMALMAREATSKGDQSQQQLGFGASVRLQDPSAALAGRLYMANLRRLLATPFLVSAHCCAAHQRVDAARSLAGALQALVHEIPFDRPQQEEMRLPSGASVHGDTLDSGPPATPAWRARLLRQYDELRFETIFTNDPLARIPYLADAQGSATLFRFPVSVRGGVPGVRVKQLPPDFHPGGRVYERPAEHLDLGRFHAGGHAFIRIHDLTKHALITGFTGSGKTVTVMQFICQLWVDHDIPFLVLESAKQEYRGLVRVEALRQKKAQVRVYTLGNELCVPFRLNPFELLPGVRVEAHLSKLQTCFEGAIPPLGPSSSVINEALLRVYQQAGWSLTDVYPLHGLSRRPFPVLSDFVKMVQQVLVDRAYEGEVKSNLQAALVGRFKPLLLGGKGRIFDTQRSVPSPRDLLTHPTILEMNDLSLDDKALVVMFLLTLLREFREIDRSAPGQLKHVSVVEEAHNVLENVSSTGSGEGATAADTRYKAVQAFCSLLTEIRALGEGLIIADQSPEKLARDAIRNTNLQVAHQLRDAKDRGAIAEAMIMEEEQRDYLGKLPPGHAALFQTGLEKATFVHIHRFAPSAEDERARPDPSEPAALATWKAKWIGYGFAPFLTDSELFAHMSQVEPELPARRRLSLPFVECNLCGSPCDFRDSMFVEASSAAAIQEGKDWLALTDRAFRETQGLTLEQVWDQMAALAQDPIGPFPAHERLDPAWCFFVHVWDRAMVSSGYDRGCAENQLEAAEKESLGRALTRLRLSKPAGLLPSQ